MTPLDHRNSQDTYDNRLKKCLAYNARLMIHNMTNTKGSSYRPSGRL